MKKLSLIIGLIATALIGAGWYSQTVYSSSTVAATVTDTSIVSNLSDMDFLYLESYYSGTGYVKTDIQTLIGGSWVTIIDDDSTGAQYKQLTLNNNDTVRVRAGIVRIINAITVSSGTSTFRQSIVGK